MTTEELLKLHNEMCSKARQIMVKKNHDYAGASGEKPFANFEVAEKLGLCETEIGILMRMTDKIMRLKTFIRSGKLEVSESAEDACVDIMNYSVLLAGCILEKAKYQV